ncbi:MAG: SAM-dependent chlorinase/fluorinase [Flavobacteriia bacterium]|nr:SAM-dependent chlorinase/fluorinase [Flavobacteriia bacterium]
MQIITLTTDMGLQDHYVAALKGTILKLCPTAQVVDISHHVKPFNISEAAYYISSCIHDFPAGTVHIIGVDTEPIVNFSGADGSFPSILKYNEQYIISNDNGFFGAFLNEKEYESFWRIDDLLSNPKLFTFPTKNMFIPIACKLIQGEKVENLASEFPIFKKAFTQTAIIEPNLIKGSVIHIDNYGNLIINVNKELFNRFGNDVPFTIYFRSREYYIDKISASYNEVPDGEKVAIFNENGLLEIAINRGANNGNGGAEKLFGIHLGDVVRIEFAPRGSKETLDSLF